jgi:hypothetical protein
MNQISCRQRIYNVRFSFDLDGFSSQEMMTYVTDSRKNESSKLDAEQRVEYRSPLRRTAAGASPESREGLVPGPSISAYSNSRPLFVSGMRCKTLHSLQKLSVLTTDPKELRFPLADGEVKWGCVERGALLLDFSKPPAEVVLSCNALAF